MKKKMPKRLLAAAVLSTLMISSAVKADAWVIGQRIDAASGITEIGSSSNFSYYQGLYQGALVTWGSGVNLSITDDGQAARFENNSGVTDAGGAVFNDANSSIVFNSASEFINNYSYRAGAIWNNGKLTFVGDAKFSGNYATTQDSRVDFAGGAIMNSKLNGSDTTGELTFNNNVIFENNRANKGGAIKQGGNLTVNGKATFTGNHATSGSGGAVYSAAGSGEGSRKETYNTLTASRNTATENGGFYYVGKDGEFVVEGAADIQNNQAGKFGGAIYTEGIVNVGANSVFENNAAISANMDNITSGGAIYSNAGDVTIGEDSLFEGNYVQGDIDHTVTWDVQGSSGGAIASWNAGNVTIGARTQFINNGKFDTSITDGGAIYFSGSSATSESGNKGILTIGDNVLFDGNKSYKRGGAVYNGDGIVKTGDNVVFSNNYSNSGAAIYALDNTGLTKTTVGDNNQFINNTAENDSGGAIMAAYGTLEIGKNALFSGNTAGYAGGAIKNYGSAIIKEGAAFINNEAKALDNGGGAISNSGTATIAKGALFSGNKSSNVGGAVYNDGTSLVINGGSVTKTDASGTKYEQKTEFINNSATNKGGAIYNAASMELNTDDGDISFANNTANNVANDIFAAEYSTSNITGSHNVSIGSGLKSEVNSIINVNEKASLVIEENVTADISGSISTTADAVITNNGTINLNSTSSSTGNINNTETGVLNIAIDNSAASVQNMADITNDGNVNITGNVSGGSITNNGDITVEGTYITDVIQNSSEASILVDGGIFGTGETLEAGSLTIVNGGKVDGTVNVTEAVEVSVGDAVFDSTGLRVGGDPLNGHITGKFNLRDTNIQLKDILTSDLTISGESVIQTDQNTVSVGNGSSNTLTLSNGSSGAAGGKGFYVTSPATIKLSPDAGKSMTLDEKVTGGGYVLVDEKVTQIDNPEYDEELAATVPGYSVPEKIDKHWGVGTVNITSDNSGFSGAYTQNDGTVVVHDGAIFFGGTNSVNTIVDPEGGYKGGSLVLEDGALLSNAVSINGNSDASVGDLASVTFKGDVTGKSGIANDITQEDIKYGAFNYAATTKTGLAAVQVNNAGVLFSNGTIIKELDADTNSLVLSKDEGVRLIGFGNGSGVEGDVTLGEQTGLVYTDGAYINNDTTLNMTNADLVFANNSSDIKYDVTVAEGSSGNISMYGSGTTSVSSKLNGKINVASENGVLNLDNKTTTDLGSVRANEGTINLKADNVKVKDVSVTGQNAAANFSGNVTDGGAATVSDSGSLGLFGSANFDSLNTNNGNLNLASGAINTVNIDGAMTVSNDSTISFDADPRSQTTDQILAGSLDNPNGNQILVTGINFTQSPIDKNVSFDISNLVNAGGAAAGDGLIKLPDGGIITNTAMGQYLLSSSGAGTPMLTANLTYLNPQMYRGQVATIASWQNQLLVNNLLFDHMNLVTRKLMDEERTANKYAAAIPQIDPYQYNLQDGSLWFKAYGAFETLSMTKGLNVGNNAYGSIIGADFPLVNLKNGWKLVPTAYIGYNGAHQHFNGVSMYQNGAQLGIMGTAYKGDFMTSLLAYGGGYANDMTVRGEYGNGSDTTGNWFAGVASKSAYNIRLPHDFIIQPAFMAAYNAFGQQNWGSNFGSMSMSSGMLNGLNVAPGLNFIWQKKTFSIYAMTQLVYNVMGGVDGKAGNVDLGYVRMRHCYFEYGLGVMKKFKDTFSGYLQFTIRNGGRTGIGFSGGLQWKVGK